MSLTELPSTALETQTVTETNVLSTTITNTETTISTATATLVATLTTTVIRAPNAAPVKMRAAKGPLSETVLASYDASRISSACACLTIPINVVLTTLTAAAVTETSSATATVQTTTTATLTALETTTLQATVTSTTTTVSTAIVAPAPPTALPTAFRLVSTNAAGQKVYYQRFNFGYPLGDLLLQTTDVAQAVIFHLDAQNHLAFTSPAYSTPVIAWYGSTYFTGDSNAVVVPFNTQPLSSGNTAYKWSYDPASGALTTTTGGEIGLVFQTCSRIWDASGVPRQQLFVQPGAVYTAGGCVAVSLTVEAA
jgi:hypothetical protein